MPSIDALTDAATLAAFVGPVERVSVAPLQGVGYSNAVISRVTVNEGAAERTFVLKRTRLDEDWTARRTGDGRGREALLLGEPDLAPVWEIFDCPYIAYAAGRGEIALLMHDLTAGLFPDARTPLSDEQEIAVLGALARMHARFWDSRVSALGWLVRPDQYCDLLAPGVAEDPAALAVLSPALRDTVPCGWAAALARLPAPVVRQLVCPGAAWARCWRDLPQTLLHGDVKVANFALGPGGRVAAFDWATIGAGPCTVDLGWYLAVNASRLSGPKEQVAARYRRLLETSLGEPVDDAVWGRLETVAIVCGSRMLLWSKALALEEGRAGADEEWRWWIDRLKNFEGYMP